MDRNKLTAELDGLVRTIGGLASYLAMGALLVWLWDWPGWWLAVGAGGCLLWDVGECLWKALHEYSKGGKNV